jgi:hypothetical protein
MKHEGASATLRRARQGRLEARGRRENGVAEPQQRQGRCRGRPGWQQPGSTTEHTTRSALSKLGSRRTAASGEHIFGCLPASFKASIRLPFLASSRETAQPRPFLLSRPWRYMNKSDSKAPKCLQPLGPLSLSRPMPALFDSQCLGSHLTEILEAFAVDGMKITCPGSTRRRYHSRQGRQKKHAPSSPPHEFLVPVGLYPQRPQITCSQDPCTAKQACWGGLGSPSRATDSVVIAEQRRSPGTKRQKSETRQLIILVPSPPPLEILVVIPDLHSPLTVLSPVCCLQTTQHYTRVFPAGSSKDGRGNQHELCDGKRVLVLS